MREDSYSLNRRSLLAGLVSSGAISLAGCQGIDSTDDPSETRTETESDVDTETTPTAAPDQAPQIVSQSAQPQNNGQSLIVGMQAEDDEGLEYAAIRYGDKTEENTGIEGRRIDLNGELTNLGGSELEEKPGQVLYLARDTAGQETRVEAYPDENPPELLNFSATPTGNAGEIALLLEGRDDIGLEEVQLLLGEQPQLQENVSGQKEYRTDQNVELSEDASFQQNTVTASLEDWNGNTTETEAETYVRKYDVMEDNRLDIGVEYFQLGQRMFTNCLESGVDTHPSIETEEYGDPIQPATTSRHIDQMQGHGIDRVIYTFNGDGNDEEKLKTFMNSELADSINIEAGYFISPSVWDTADDLSEEIVEPHMSVISEHVLSRDNVATFRNQPTFMVDNATAWVGRENSIKDEWGSYDNFIEDIRNLLKTDGKEPFIIAGMGAQGARDSYIDEHANLTRQCDAVTNLVAVPVWSDQEDKTATQMEVLDWMEENYKGHREFAQENNLEFFPRVFPGFDRRANTCWGDDELVPRSKRFFKDILNLADEYRTSDRLNVFTWNDFTEGTAIEPGTFRGNDYGTEYLEIIEDLQKK